MKLSDLGERALIKQINTILDDANIAVGPGDDCAAIEIGEDYLLITTDMMTRSTHLPQYITPYQIGWQIVAINLSDIAAKGGLPLGLVISLGLPEDYELEQLKDLVRGMNECAKKFRTTIIGGDLKSNPEVTLCGTAIGKVPKSAFMGRKGCSPGDLVAVTGELGGAASGYYALQNSLDSAEYETGLNALYEPYPRVQEGRVLAESGAVTAGMDISDGLASSLFQMSEINSMGFELEWEKVPVAPIAIDISGKLDMSPQDLALYFGGEYELVVTLNPTHAARAIEALEVECGTKFTVIGKVIAEKENSLIIDGKKEILENRGYEHFVNSLL